MIRLNVSLALWFGLAVPLPALADCSRPLQVPVAPIGQAVTVTDGKVGGIFPELLRAEAAKAGCVIEFQPVPRSRLEKLFELGQADLLMPARRSVRRDEYGHFVGMIHSRAVLLAIEPRVPAIRSAAELLRHRELRVGVVRGYDYDDSYQVLVKQLAAQQRLTEATDPVSLARMLDAGTIDVAVVTPTAVTGALRASGKWAPLVERLHSIPVDELVWGESGAYVSRHASLSEADRRIAREMLEHIAKSGAAWREFQRYFPEANLSESVRAH
ncbi:substrate-binding periplasmic protein [Burkholderiaceae bacterium UC74_6]